MPAPVNSIARTAASSALALRASAHVKDETFAALIHARRDELKAVVERVVEEEILEALLPRYVRTQLFAALLEREASEQGASMTAMDNATRNAGDLIERLTLVYNRTRQATITKELIEIISGAEAV